MALGTELVFLSFEKQGKAIYLVWHLMGPCLFGIIQEAGTPWGALETGEAWARVETLAECQRPSVCSGQGVDNKQVPGLPIPGLCPVLSPLPVWAPVSLPN